MSPVICLIEFFCCLHDGAPQLLVVEYSIYLPYILACNDVNCSADKWMSRLEGSNWLTHVQTALNAACLVAQCLDQEGTSVLVHGASGLDSTLLVTSVVQVILNPDCRTVRGKVTLFHDVIQESCQEVFGLFINMSTCKECVRVKPILQIIVILF